MENKKVIDKIRKLMALAENNPEENEAIAAALKAQKLMAEHGIELVDVKDAPDESPEIIEARYDFNSGGHNMSKWKWRLAGIVAQNFRCKIYAVGREAIVFYGLESDVTIAQEVFVSLYKIGNRLANRLYYSYKKEGRSTRGVMNDYLIGFTDGVGSALGKQCKALMIVTPKEVEEGWELMSAHMRTMRNTLSSRGDLEARAKGRADGASYASQKQLNA